MLTRCYNKIGSGYENYGKKGIKICDEWLKDSSLFEDWAFNNGYKDNLTIDRINSKGNYCPENCRWVTLADNNKFSHQKIICVNGIEHNYTEWGDIIRIDGGSIRKYMQKYGKENVKEFLRRWIENPNIKPKGRTSLYRTYME